MVLDLSTPADGSLHDLVTTLVATAEPLVVFLPRDPNEEERKHIAQLGRRSEPVRIASSTAQLQDQVALILHRPFENLPLNAQAALQQLRRCDPLLAGKKVVVIDDDIRNIFSLTSALEEHGVELHYAESGRSGIEILQRLPDADAVLVDIMMPGMDGYQTMQEIRSMPEFSHAAGDRGHRQGDEGRPSEMHRRGRIGLRRQARGHRPARLRVACLVSADGADCSHHRRSRE